MTTYSAADFARAAFARHSNGCRAVAHNLREGSATRWTLDCSPHERSDLEMSRGGWVPVQEQAGYHAPTDEDHGGPRDEDAEFWHARWKEAADRADARDAAAQLWKETARHLFGAREVVRLSCDLETGRADKAERACKTLGKVVEDQCRDIARITRSEHLVDADGDADWGAIWERGHELAGRLEKAEKEQEELRAAVAELAPAEVCVHGNWFKPSELPDVLGRMMDSRDEAQREAKRHYLRAGQPRSLTPDDITDRFVDHVHEDYFWSTEERVRLDKRALRNALRDAVKRSQDPTRPEWETESAERIEGAVWGVELPNEAGETGTLLAARLARHGYKVVPVTGAES